LLRLGSRRAANCPEIHAPVLPYQLSSKHQREQPLPRRAAGLALALAINLLLLLVLLSLGVGRVDRPKGSPTVLIDLPS